MSDKYMNVSTDIQGFRVDCRKVDCSFYTTNEVIQNMLNEYNIQAFPTVILLIPENFRSKMGDVTYLKYKGKITVKTLETFVNQTVQEMKS